MNTQIHTHSQCVIVNYCIQTFTYLQITKDQSLSLFHGHWPWKELQLVAADPSTSKSWKNWLSFVILHQPVEFADDNKMDSWLKKKYMHVKIGQGGHVHVLGAMSEIADMKLWQANKVWYLLHSMHVAIAI